jgi:predicted DCC family thiol-disulfide oxidoreductase YuxK
MPLIIRSSKTVIAASGFTYVIGCRPLRWLNHRSARQPKTYVKPEAAITVFELLMMSGLSLETCWAIKKHWNNKCHRSGRQPQTYVKPEAATTVFELLLMSGVSLETCWAIKKHWNNKFSYTVAFCWLFLYDLLFIYYLCIISQLFSASFPTTCLFSPTHQKIFNCALIHSYTVHFTS